MEIIVKGKNGVKIDEEIRKYAEDKVRKYERLLAEPVVCDIVLDDLRGQKSGVDKSVHITLEAPGLKQPIHVEETTSDWRGSVDLAQKRLEQQIRKYKAKKVGTRFPVKYWAEKVLERLGIRKRVK